jgi:protein-disulfide isomerase
VLEKYPNEVKLIFKNFPLTKHRFAKRAAMAAFAARRQGKFWEFHDLLFENFDRLSDQKIWQIARELGLDLERFEKDMKDLVLVAKINQEIRLGARAGVRGTPTIFINGRVSRAKTLKGLQGAVEKEVARIGKGTAAGGKPLKQ